MYTTYVCICSTIYILHYTYTTLYPGSHAADLIIKDHPQPHRLKVFLQLEGKNVGLILPDADIDVAIEQILLG